MSLSIAKQARMARSKRIERVRRLYPQWPFGVLDHYIECALQSYVQTGNQSDPSLPERLRGGVS